MNYRYTTLQRENNWQSCFLVGPTNKAWWLFNCDDIFPVNGILAKDPKISLNLLLFVAGWLCDMKLPIVAIH
jgi:hypothetical protein